MSTELASPRKHSTTEGNTNVYYLHYGSAYKFLHCTPVFSLDDCVAHLVVRL